MHNINGAKASEIHINPDKVRKFIKEIEPQEQKKNPCQLHKIHGSGIIKCNFDCAITNSCPIFYIDSMDRPIINASKRI